MSTSNLLWFAAVVGAALLLLLWRLIRAEDGHGFIPIGGDVACILGIALCDALFLACLAFVLVLLIA